MPLTAWATKRINNMEWYDISLVKLSTAAFILWVAKLWTPLLSLDTYWYLVIGIAAAIIPFRDMFRQ